MYKAACKLSSEMDHSSTWLLVSGKLLQVITVQRSGFEAFLSCGYHVKNRWLCLISLLNLTPAHSCQKPLAFQSVISDLTEGAVFFSVGQPELL